MADAMQGLVAEAKKNKYSTIANGTSEEDVSSVWDNVSAYVEKQMAHQKGVHIPGLGTFTFSQKKLDVGNNKHLLIQRPVFLLSEKFAQTHGLHHNKHHVSGQIPVVQLNYAALSLESPFDRDCVEACVKEVLGALQRSVSSRKNVEFAFNGIGRLQIRDSKVKMKFYKDFINNMDGSGKLLQSLKDRPGTVDSVMSDRAPSRPLTGNTMVLPRITNGNLGQILEEDEDALKTSRTAADPVDINDVDAAYDEEQSADEDKNRSPDPVTSRGPLRTTVHLAQATGVCFLDDLIPPVGLQSPKGVRGISPLSKANSPPMTRRSLSPLRVPASPRIGQIGSQEEPPTSKSANSFLRRPMPLTGRKPVSPLAAERPNTTDSCGHANAGQELCYLCHQRARRNIPVSFTEERKQQEQEEDKLLQQFQHLKDSDAIHEEQEQVVARQHNNKKMAAFNLGVSEAIKTKKTTRDTDFHASYVFQKRPLTPPRFIQQDLYSQDLADQVHNRLQAQKKRKSDEDFLERLEQVQLAEDLAAQREQYLQSKYDQQEQYKRALSAQVRFKPTPMPARFSDSTDPYFGRNDMNNDKMLERRHQAHDLYQEQLGTVEQRKREAILKRLQEQKEEEDVLKRTKEELIDDRADRYRRLFVNRKRIEEDWFDAVDDKKDRDANEKLHTKSAGMLLHEQCDKYSRCGQCKRKNINCGESNIWRESRYIPGSRIMI